MSIVFFKLNAIDSLLTWGSMLQLSARYSGLQLIPAVITHSPILVIPANLHPPLQSSICPLLRALQCFIDISSDSILANIAAHHRNIERLRFISIVYKT